MIHYSKEYSKSLPEFSKEICIDLDKIIHDVYPEIQEGKKWGSVSYWIDEGLICGFFASKNFVTLTFFNGSLLQDKSKLFSQSADNVKDRSIKFKSLQELYQVADVLSGYIVETIDNRKKGKKVAIGKKKIETPRELQTTLKKEKLLEKFETLSYSMRKDYIEWISDAKKEATKKQRIEKAIYLLSQGKGLYDKYK